MLSTLGGWSGGYSDPDCELSDKQVCEGMGKLVRTTGLFTFERCTANNLLRIRGGVRVGQLLPKKLQAGSGRGRLGGQQAARKRYSLAKVDPMAHTRLKSLC